MRVSRRSGSALALLLLAGGAAAFVCVARHGPAGVLEITPDRDDTLVYADGRFLGMAGTKEPLALRLAPGTHDLRLSCQGFADLMGRLQVEADKKTSVRAAMPDAEHAPDPL